MAGDSHRMLIPGYPWIIAAVEMASFTMPPTDNPAFSAKFLRRLIGKKSKSLPVCGRQGSHVEEFREYRVDLPKAKGK
jgi:hypothetical protein